MSILPIGGSVRVDTQKTAISTPISDLDAELVNADVDKTNTTSGTILNPSERKSAMNAATLQAHLDVDVSVKGKPLELLYKAAIEAIDKELEPVFGKDATQTIAERGDDYSPEAVAERIVSFSTHFFASYQNQNPDQDLSHQLDTFIDIVSGGVDSGFGEAREILDGLGVLEGEIQVNIDKTYSLVMSGYDAFKQQTLNPDASR